MHLILAFALVGQFSNSANEIGRGDLTFAAAVESFVVAAKPGAKPPEPYLSMIERMGGGCWSCREGATRRLERTVKASMADQRWLFWGRRHLDLEVRLRSNSILFRLNPCSTCKGTRQSKNWDAWPCWDCNGSGTAWPYTIWD